MAITLEKKSNETQIAGEIDGDELVIRIPIPATNRKPSKSGKSLTLASHRFATINGASIEGIPVKVAGLTVYLPMVAG